MIDYNCTNYCWWYGWFLFEYKKCWMKKDAKYFNTAISWTFSTHWTSSKNCFKTFDFFMCNFTQKKGVKYLYDFHAFQNWLQTRTLKNLSKNGVVYDRQKKRILSSNRNQSFKQYF